MQHTSSGRKYHPCPTPPTKTRRVVTITLTFAEIAFYIVLALIAAAIVAAFKGGAA